MDIMIDIQRNKRGDLVWVMGSDDTEETGALQKTNGLKLKRARKSGVFDPRTPPSGMSLEMTKKEFAALRRQAIKELKAEGVL